MFRCSSRLAWFAPLVFAAACGAPFVGVAPSESDAGAGEVDEVDTGGALAGGGRPGAVVKPTSAGADAGGAVTSAAAGQPSGADGAAAGETGSRGSAHCPSLAGEKLALADGYCIDENEVTAAHYRAFLDSKPDVSAQPAVCAGNLSFSNTCKFTSPEKEPQRCVDWCDARAYCESVGKRLCGSSSGGAMAFDSPAAASENQWYAACSHAGAHPYPYGDEYDGGACWGADRPTAGALTVKSAAGCVGGYEGVWDMSGSLAEWIDSCNAESGMADSCRIRGGASSGTAEQLRCDAEAATMRSTSSSYIGFRCCAELAR
jgi:formylglycine-generating enzyme